jgi:hypothetical protein
MLDVLIGTGKTPVDTVNFSHITASYGYMDAYCTNSNCSAWPNFYIRQRPVGRVTWTNNHIFWRLNFKIQ